MTGGRDGDAGGGIPQQDKARRITHVVARPVEDPLVLKALRDKLYVAVFIQDDLGIKMGSIAALGFIARVLVVFF